MERLVTKTPGRAMPLLFAAVLALAVPPAGAEPRRVTGSSVADDAEAFIKAPFEADGDAWLRTAAAGAAIGVSMMWLDEGVDRLVREEPGDFPWLPARRLASLSSWYGRNGRNALIFSAGLAGAVAAGGWLADEDRMVDTAAIMAESVLFSMSVVAVSKIVFGRARPNAERGAHSYAWFVGPFERTMLSFPSGHAATAFALAGAGAGRHPHWYVQVPAYLLATSASIQRMDARAHWTSDVLTGALLGYAVSAFLVDRYDGEAAGAESGAGLSLSFSVRF